jgi:hypothetical protein
MMSGLLRLAVGHTFTTHARVTGLFSSLCSGMSLIISRIAAGKSIAAGFGAGMGPGSSGRLTVKRAMTGVLVVIVLLIGVSLGRAYDTDETVLNVQVSSADHETQEGYFTLGEQATVMVKPGSDLFRFLSRNKGQKVKIVLTQHEERQLSQIQRVP